MKTDAVKANGIHFTPPELASFLAQITAKHLFHSTGVINVLDPACGDGELLQAFTQAVDAETRHRLVLIGYETNPAALKNAKSRLESLPVLDIRLAASDFLLLSEFDCVPDSRQHRLMFSDEPIAKPWADVVIANPPYVRTQVLGASQARKLAKRFGLSGRVDLYHAFVKAMSAILKNDGVLGLLTSNRFLTIKSGITLRRLLGTDFAVQDIYDLGDTKLFSAAVLPVIVVAKKGCRQDSEIPQFDRIYEHRGKIESGQKIHAFDNVLEALKKREVAGIVRTPSGTYQLERGHLRTRGLDRVWALSTPQYDRWLDKIGSARQFAFEDIAHVRVGIKTTCDDVFIRRDWSSVLENERPESELIRPLIRSYEASRWTLPQKPNQSVVYPHLSHHGQRVPINLKDFPRAARYFTRFREKLADRHYVIQGGRQWFEIWVPHHPDEWSRPKIVFPDIAEQPRFFFDDSGAIVNGDCYWITLRPGIKLEWLFLMLAVANSTFIIRYYDLAFHNKLYAGRRRFMAQYVRHFPLPRIEHRASRRIIPLVAELIKNGNQSESRENEIDDLVWQSFDLTKEV